MIDNNDVYVSGRVKNARFHTSKNGKEFVSLNIVVSNLAFGQSNNGKKESFPTYLSVMVFNPKQVEYIKNCGAVEGDFANIHGMLSNVKNSNGYGQLSVTVLDVTIAKSGNAESPNVDDVLYDEPMDC